MKAIKAVKEDSSLLEKVANTKPINAKAMLTEARDTKAEMMQTKK